MGNEYARLVNLGCECINAYGRIEAVDMEWFELPIIS